MTFALGSASRKELLPVLGRSGASSWWLLNKLLWLLLLLSTRIWISAHGWQPHLVVIFISLDASLGGQAIWSIAFLSSCPTRGFSLSIYYLPFIKVLLSCRVLYRSLGAGSLGSRLGIWNSLVSSLNISWARLLVCKAWRISQMLPFAPWWIQLPVG